MKWLIIFSFIFSLNTYADAVKVEINPTRPVAGEPFQAYFRIFTDTNEEPSINFSPGGIEVIGKSNQGISTKFVYSNGHITTNTREITVVYDLVAAKPGHAFIRDITVQMGGETLRHSSLTINILKEPEVAAEVFVMADVPKKTVFLGEGVIVRYYLYSKVPVSNLDVKKYPKLNNFLKRFLQEPDSAQRVAVDGQIYSRNQIYAAKLYPEKTGELKIDPIELAATYSMSLTGDPFAVFNMNRELKTRTLRSEEIKVLVRPLPTPVPSHFTGLIGKHSFELDFSQNKILVNQPLEVKLTVTGGGALENLEAPAFLKHQALEEFETNGDLKIANADQAAKTFEYTFLARENLKLPASALTLSYFDSNTEKYVPVQLDIPEIEVGGGEALTKKEVKSEEKTPEKQVNKTSGPKAPFELLGPALSSEKNFKKWLPYINSSLALLAFLIVLGWAVRKDGLPQLNARSEIPVTFKKGNFTLSEFVRWLAPVIQKTGKSPSVIIKESSLDEDTKSYFIDLLNSNDYKDYAVQKAQADFKYRPEHFKRLGRYIESVKNESPT